MHKKSGEWILTTLENGLKLLNAYFTHVHGSLTWIFMKCNHKWPTRLEKITQRLIAVQWVSHSVHIHCCNIHNQARIWGEALYHTCPSSGKKLSKDVSYDGHFWNTTLSIFIMMFWKCDVMIVRMHLCVFCISFFPDLFFSLFSAQLSSHHQEIVYRFVLVMYHAPNYILTFIKLFVHPPIYWSIHPLAHQSKWMQIEIAKYAPDDPTFFTIE